MLSNKWTFSLKILVVMLAVAFVGTYRNGGRVRRDTERRHRR